MTIHPNSNNSTHHSSSHTQSTSSHFHRSQPSKPSYYAILKVAPWANAQDIRKAYRDLSKIYHPDTTTLPKDNAKEKFQILNEAYAVLSSPDQRSKYDLHNGYSRFSVVQPTQDLNQPTQPFKVPGWPSKSRIRSNSAYLDPNDRPLSSGEVFAVALLGITFISCLGLVLLASMFRGDVAFPAAMLTG